MFVFLSFSHPNNINFNMVRWIFATHTKGEDKPSEEEGGNIDYYCKAHDINMFIKPISLIKVINSKLVS